MKLTRWLSIVVVLFALVVAPVSSLAQNFPSQQGGGTTPAGGGFPSQGQQPVRGGFYQSTSYGFSLTFGPPWGLVEQVGGPGAGFEGVVVSNGPSVVSVMGVTDSNTPQVIVQNVADNLGVPMNFLEVAVDEPEVAAAYYVSADGEMGARILASRINAADAFLLIWLFPTAQYEAEGEAYNLLIDGLQFGA